jgi:hypothetical protein
MLHTIVAAIAQLLLVLRRMITRGQVLTPTARPLGYELSVLRWLTGAFETARPPSTCITGCMFAHQPRAVSRCWLKH